MRNSITTNLLRYKLLTTAALYAALVIGSFLVSRHTIHSQNTLANYAYAINAMLEALQRTQLDLFAEQYGNDTEHNHSTQNTSHHSPKVSFLESVEIYTAIRELDPDGGGRGTPFSGEGTKQTPQLAETSRIQKLEIAAVREKYGLLENMPVALAALWEAEEEPPDHADIWQGIINRDEEQNHHTVTSIDPLETLVGRAITIAAPIFSETISPEDRTQRTKQFEELMRASVEPKAHATMAQLRSLTQESQAWSEAVLLAVAFVGIAVAGFIVFGIFRPLEKQVVLDRERIQAARRKAEAADHAKSEFLANMSHEIRTPMNGVMGMAELLLMTDVNAVQKDYAQTILQSGNALLTIINDILDFSKISDGKLELDSKPFNLSGLVNDVTALVTPNANAKGLEITSRIHPKLPDQLVGDAGRLRQVLVNFVGNAVKFTDEGHVAINVTGTANDGFSKIKIDVEDTGIGIPEDRLDTIFEKFNQVDNTDSREYEGTGLGLTICQMLIEKMGGSVQVESSLGQGSKFSFQLSLPAIQTVAAKQAPLSDVMDVQISNLKKIVQHEPDTNTPKRGPSNRTMANHAAPCVLVVEDNVVNQKVVSAFLECLKVDFMIAEDGQQALDVLEEHTPSLVFMDMSMPVLNGIDATIEIRRREAMVGKHTVIIGLTANAIKGDREKCLAAGMDDYLSKPIDLAKLEACLQTWLPHHEHNPTRQAAI